MEASRAHVELIAQKEAAWLLIKRDLLAEIRELALEHEKVLEQVEDAKAREEMLQAELGQRRH